jgi:hypothetical protein
MKVERPRLPPAPAGPVGLRKSHEVTEDPDRRCRDNRPGNRRPGRPGEHRLGRRHPRHHLFVTLSGVKYHNGRAYYSQMTWYTPGYRTFGSHRSTLVLRFST